MSKYRNDLPQLGQGLFLTDGGLETTLIFHDGLELPEFAAFDLLNTERGLRALKEYYASYVKLANKLGLGFILESPTWRANPDWGTKLGYSASQLYDLNLRSIALMEQFRSALKTEQVPMVVSGCMGPRGDGYVVETKMSAQQACDYHSEQMAAFAESTADMACAMTLNYVEEAVGIVMAAEKANMPVAIAFTVEVDGMLPSGQSLASAIEQVDQITSTYPAYYMINCAHPSHFDDIANESGSWIYRIRGIRANASSKSHAELDEATELDAGNPEELGKQYIKLKKTFPNLNVMGGCCGTDCRHVTEIAQACMLLFEGSNKVNI